MTCPTSIPILIPVMKIGFPPADPTMDLEEFFKTICPPKKHKLESEPVMNKTYKPKTITLPAEIVELVMNNCSDGEPPQNKEEWNELIAEIVEEYFNY